jgi:hypothetical protein
LQDRLDGSGAQAKHSTQSPETVSPPSDAGAVAGVGKITQEAKSDEAENGAQEASASDGRTSMGSGMAPHDAVADADDLQPESLAQDQAEAASPHAEVVESDTPTSVDDIRQEEDLDAPQPVENVVSLSPSTMVEKPVAPRFTLVKNDVKKDLHVGETPLSTSENTSGKAVTPLFTVPPQVKWVVEWKTTSKNRRELIYHLKWLDKNTWKPVTRQMVEQGKINVQGALIRSLRKFTPQEAEKIERLGRDAVKRYVGLIIDRNRLRRAG